MSEVITTAVITGGLAFLGTLISNATLHSKTIYRIEQLEKKQDKHNSLIERMYVVEERAKSNTHRIDEIEKRAG